MLRRRSVFGRLPIVGERAERQSIFGQSIEQASFQDAVQMGHRIVEPQIALRMAEAQEAARRRTQPVVDVGSAHAFFPSHAIAGQRMAHDGAFGRQNPLSDFMDARMQAGAMAQGGRAPGFDSSQDWSEENQRFAFQLNLGETMHVAVPKDRPWITMRSTNALELRVRVSARVEDGSDNNRIFSLGGGFTASFNLSAYSTLRVEAITGVAGATLTAAFISQGLQTSDMYLYDPTVRPALGPPPPGGWGPFAVPEGAYEVVAMWADAGWQWIFSPAGLVNFDPPGGLAAGVIEQVRGNQYFMAVTPNSLLWICKPL